MLRVLTLYILSSVSRLESNLKTHSYSGTGFGFQASNVIAKDAVTYSLDDASFSLLHGFAVLGRV